MTNSGSFLWCTAFQFCLDMCWGKVCTLRFSQLYQRPFSMIPSKYRGNDTDFRALSESVAGKRFDWKWPPWHCGLRSLVFNCRIPMSFICFLFWFHNMSKLLLGQILWLEWFMLSVNFRFQSLLYFMSTQEHKSVLPAYCPITSMTSSSELLSPFSAPWSWSGWVSAAPSRLEVGLLKWERKLDAPPELDRGNPPEPGSRGLWNILGSESTDWP